MIYGLKHIAQDGPGWQPVLFILAGLVIGGVFVQRQRKLADPLIDLGLFRLPAFSMSLVTYTLGVFVAFGVFLFIAQYLQLVLGLSPLEAGLWSVSGAVTSIIGSNVAPGLVRRVRPAFIIAGGLVLGAIGFGLLTQIGPDSLALVVLGWGIMSLGFGATFTLTADLPSGIPAAAAKAAQETLSGAVTMADQLPNSLGAALLHTAHEAFIQGLQITSVIGVVVMIGLAILTVVWLRHIGHDNGAAGQPESKHPAHPSPLPLQPDVYWVD